MSKGSAKYWRLVSKARKHIIRRIEQEWAGTPVSLPDVKVQAAKTARALDDRSLERAARDLCRAGLIKPTDDPNVYVPLIPGRSVTR